MYICICVHLSDERSVKATIVVGKKKSEKAKARWMESPVSWSHAFFAARSVFGTCVFEAAKH